ncbi:hypothetical protein BCR35DRAFT_306717 [Leucosporidium creatinivorum]|uniref:F-box domain-containing protein n=1 Tax=Leucosporidium creatinivorum TaxID=106004 RepID=A0A1Y2ERQ3_9BASI|nr:hypothetical protein BCR35DRAFT_306717 [Leucosporidium creatinivorum]
MDEGLTEKLEKLSVQSESATASIPSIPSELIQHILNFLDPTSKDTLTTLLNCQLVSRSFAASSLAPVVWRPLVQARWERGKLKYPAYKLPLEEDQKLVDQLFPSPARDAPSDPFVVFRARWKLDGIAERHIERLVNGTKDRLVSIETTSVLGDLVWSHLWRTGPRMDAGSASLTQRWWCRELLGCAARFTAFETWLAIAEGRLAGGEAIELGIAAFDAFGRDGFRSSSTRFTTAIAGQVSRALQQEDNRGSDSDEPFEELEHVVSLLLGVYKKCRFVLSRSPELVLDRSGNLDEMFLQLAVKRLAFAKGPQESEITLHPTACAAVFAGFARRLAAPFEIKVELNAYDSFRVSWKKLPNIALVIDMRDGEGFGSMYDANLTEGDEANWLTPSEVLARYGSDMSHRAVEENVGGSTSASPQEAYAASMICCTIFVDNDIKENIFPSLLQQFRPPRAHDLPLLEHCILPTLSDIRSAQQLLKVIKAEDLKTPTPHHRPTDGSFNLKLRVGDTFLLRSTGEFGVVVGWEAQEGPVTRATPRPARGGRAKQKAMPLRRPIEYIYLATLESHADYTEPSRLIDAELDTARRPRTLQIHDLMEVEPLGRLFNECIEEPSRIFFVPSAETLARWPDG